MKRQPVEVARVGLGLDGLLEAVGIAVGLRLHLPERLALLLRLDGPDDLGVGDQQIVDRPCDGHELADGDPGSGREIGVGVVLQHPAGLLQHPVDMDPGFLLRVEVGRCHL